jgi:glucokinase
MSTRTAPDADRLYVGVDIGGTKVAVLVVDAELRECARVIAPAPSADGPRGVEELAASVREAVAIAGASPADLGGVGIGVPGRVDAATGTVSHAVNLRWRELTLGPSLERLLGVPCRVENDVRAAAAGLHRRGILGDVHSLAYVGIGTGIAAGIVLGGKLHRGVNGLAGEIGHMVIDPLGPRCECGLDGCFEAFAAGPGIARRARAALAAEPDRASVLRDVAAVTSVDVYRAAEAADEVAGEVAAEVGRHVAHAIHDLAMTYDVERIVLGGGVTYAGEAFMRPVLAALDALRSRSELVREVVSADVPVLLPPGSDPGAWGAASLGRWGAPPSTTPDHGQGR